MTPLKGSPLIQRMKCYFPLKKEGQHLSSLIIKVHVQNKKLAFSKIFKYSKTFIIKNANSRKSTNNEVNSLKYFLSST